MALKLTLFGSFQAQRANTALTFATNATRALLAYLAVEANRPHPREVLATLLWPDVPQTAAFANLRQTLARLRKTLGSEADAFLHITPHAIQLNPHPATTDIDVVRFEELLAECAVHPHADVVRCPACMARMQQAAALYCGEFLQGLALERSQPFEEWRLFKREELHRQILEALHTLARCAEQHADYAQARRHAQRQIELEPWREEAHQQLMRNLALGNQRSAALAQFATCRRVLADELGIEPSPQTVALYEQIRDTDAQPHPAKKEAIALSPSNLPDNLPETGAVFGRQAEAAQLTRWLLQDRCKCVALLGMGGMGKTTLAASMAHAVAPQFDEVIWVSLLNAPPLESVLRSILQTLSQNILAELPTSLDAQLSLLLSALQHSRCLIVLDNLESILLNEPVGTFRAGYEAYGQLMRRIIEEPHQSCLLFTSREQPNEVARLGNEASRRTLRLAGLPFADGLAMLNAQGVSAPEEVDVRTLVQRYSGNPLALKLVTQTIQELFSGDICEFLAADVLIFDDIRAVLDQQFARLTVLEREMLTWLAIAREPQSLPTLRANLLQVDSPREFMEALRSLQRRSLLESLESSDSPQARFGLQNVILEYATDRLVEGAGRAVANGDVQALNRYALLDTHAKEYVRQSQIRLILKPIANQLLARLGRAGIEQQCQQVLAALRTLPPRTPGYAAGNILNLLLHLGIDVTPYDFSRLSVWQADLRGVQSAALNLAEADLSHSAFTLAFDMNAIRLGTSDSIRVAGISAGELCMWQAANGQLHDAFRSTGLAANPIVFSRDGNVLAHSSPSFAIRICRADDGAPVHILAGHTAKIYRLAFSTDGTLLASSSQDGTVRIWDARTGQLVHLLLEQADAVNALAFNADGTLLAGGSSHRTLAVWDTHAGQVRRVLHGHVREVECCAFSPEGALLVSASHDGEIRMWDVQTGQMLGMLNGHTHIVRTLAFHADGHTLVSGGADRIACVWDVRSGRRLHTLLGHTEEITALSFSPDGHTLASGSVSNTVQLWDIHTGYSLNTLRGYSMLIRTVKFSPDGQLLASSSPMGQVHLWDVSTVATNRSSTQSSHSETPVRTLRGHTRPVMSLAFSPDSHRLVSGAIDHAVRVWDVFNGNTLHTYMGHNGPVKAVAVGAGGRIIASGGADQVIRLWSESQPNSPKILLGHAADVISLAFDTTGEYMVSASLDNTARLWQLKPVTDASNEPQEITVINRAVWRDHLCALHGATFNAEGSRVLTNSWDHQVCLWDVATGQRVASSDVQSFRGLGVTFSPNGALFASLTSEHQVDIWDSHMRHILCTLRDHAQSIMSIDFHPNSMLLASTGWDGTIRIWDVAGGECVKVLHSPGPYAGMNIAGATGISDAQQAALQALGAIG